MRSLGWALIQSYWSLYKKEKFKHRDVQREDIKMTGRIWSADRRDVSTSQGMTRTAGQHQKLEEARKDSHLKLLTTLRHLDFRFLASKSVRQ